MQVRTETVIIALCGLFMVAVPWAPSREFDACASCHQARSYGFRIPKRHCTKFHVTESRPRWADNDVCPAGVHAEFLAARTPATVIESHIGRRALLSTIAIERRFSGSASPVHARLIHSRDVGPSLLRRRLITTAVKSSSCSTPFANSATDWYRRSMIVAAFSSARFRIALDRRSVP